VETASGIVIVDPGPASTLTAVVEALAGRGLTLKDASAILLTHVHLDHAGACGNIVEANPAIEVYVHERGAPHLVDPTRLVQSATRLFGADMDRLWGPMLPVPEARVRILRDRDRLVLGDRRLEVAYTPGHAVHHVSYLDEATGTMFVGEVAGLRIWNTPFVYPPTPPPDIDIEGWAASLKRVSAWHAERLFIPHFGVTDHALAEHFDACWERLLRDRETVRRSLEEEGTDEDRALAFARGFVADLRGALQPLDAERLEIASNPALCWYGLARYWRQRT
jgi:glyoxylase-like metal-dependent hydrolase (beta-lactamase superfamily II)